MKKYKHFIGAIFKQKTWIVVIIIMLITLILLNYFNSNIGGFSNRLCAILFGCQEKDSILSVICFGIFSSIVASVILFTVDEYVKSCQAFDKILNRVEFILKYLEYNISLPNFNCKEHIFLLWEIYYSIIELSWELSYTEDFFCLQEGIDEVVNYLCENREVDDIEFVLNKLKNIKNVCSN